MNKLPKLSIGLVLGSVALLGCTPIAMDSIKAPPRAGIPMAPPAHSAAAQALALAGAHGIYVQVDPVALRRFQAIEEQGVRIDVDPARGRMGYNQLNARAFPRNQKYASESGRELFLATVRTDAVIVLGFGAVPGVGRYSEIIPLLRPDAAAVSVTLDLDKIAASGGYTDVANEFFYALVRVKEFRSFWEQHARGRSEADMFQIAMAYHTSDRILAVDRQALQTESEFRRERYFSWVARHYSAYDQGRDVNRPNLKVPGFVRPFEIGSSELAKDHAMYHRPHLIRPESRHSVLYCRIRAGSWRDGRDQTYLLPFIPTVGDEVDKKVMTLAEYKRRWYNYFKKDIIAEGANSPYSRSIHPNQARFPDHSTPSSFFRDALRATLREMKLKDRAAKAANARLISESRLAERDLLFGHR